MPNTALSHAARRPTVVATVRCLIVIVTMVVMPRVAAGQLLAGIDLSSRTARSGTDAWHGLYAVSPSAHLDWPRLSLDARWTALARQAGDATRDGGGLSGEGELAATFRSASYGGFQLSMTGFADRILLDETTGVSRIGADARLSYRRGASGVWLGREVAGDNRSTPVSPVARVSAGIWRQWGNAMVTFSLSSFGARVGGSPVDRPTAPPQGDSLPPVSPPGLPDTLQQPGSSPGPTTAGPQNSGSIDSSRAGSFRSWNDAQMSVFWSAGRVALHGLVGTRVFATDQPNEMWGEVNGTLAIGPRVALVAAAGVRPTNAAYGLARSRFINLGVRLAPGALLHPRLPRGVRPAPAAFEVGNAALGHRTLRVRVPNATTVELSGDFTGWKPVSLTPAEGTRWETTLPIPPGVHRLVIRVDGDAWTPPPGVSAVADEFQGTVGVIVITE